MRPVLLFAFLAQLVERSPFTEESASGRGFEPRRKHILRSPKVRISGFHPGDPSSILGVEEVSISVEVSTLDFDSSIPGSTPG